MCVKNHVIAETLAWFLCIIVVIIKITNTMEELQKAIDKANETFRNNHCGFYAEPMLSVPNTASIEIEGGDWKHDHAYADYVMRENGFVCISEKITLETEDDWYGSIHYYRFQK